jgi:ligand-binding sensor domain-containing protein
MMKALHKSLSTTILTVSIFISGVTVDFAGAQKISADPATTHRLADPLLSRYIKFGRLTTKDGLSSDQTRNVVQDKQGFMWFATLGGLNRYDGASVKVYRHDPDDPNSLAHNTVRALIADQSGELWIGTWGDGLNQYGSEMYAFIKYQNGLYNPHSQSNNIVWAVYEHRAVTLWMGTMGRLNKLDRETKQFTHYLHNPDDPNSLSHNIAWSAVEDQVGVFCISTEASRFRRRALCV